MNTISADDLHNLYLSDAHRRELAESGISPETIAAAGVYTETDPTRVGELLNWPGPAESLGPCLVFPYLDANGQPTDHHRLKPSTPRMSGKRGVGERITFEAPHRHLNRLYIAPHAFPAVNDLTAPLILTSGELNALSVDSRGYACLSLPDVWAWRPKRSNKANGNGGARELSDEMKKVAWKGRRVYLIFDTAPLDSNAQKAERALAEALTTANVAVSVIRIPADEKGEKQTLTGYLVRRGQGALDTLLASAEAQPNPPGCGDGGRGPSVTEQLVALARSHAELWHDPARTAFATHGRRTMPVRSTDFRNWLICRYRSVSGGRLPRRDALANAIIAVEALAVIDGQEREAHVRVALHAGRFYLHLADAVDTVIEVDAGGWRECLRPPVRFRKAPAARPLPRPESGGSLEEFRRLLNLEDSDQFALLVGFLCGTMLPGQPVPLLSTSGPPGCGKSTLSRALKAVVDPSAAPVRCEPRSEQDLMIAARHSHLLVFDNLSRLSEWLFDALCRLATGGGSGTRVLYTDDEEMIFDARRPVVVNGIDEVIVRDDLLERAILLRLPAIPEDKRVPESLFWVRFKSLHPKLLGALLDRVAGGLRELPNVHLLRLPRMADFARWCVACERGAGEPERFLAAYTANQRAGYEQALEESSLAEAVVAFMSGRGRWEGTPTDLHKELSRLVLPHPIPRDWPKAPNALTGKLHRLATNLRRVYRLDFQTDRHTDSGRRRVVRLIRDLDGSGQ